LAPKCPEAVRTATMNILGEYRIPHSKRYEHTTTAKLRRFLDTAYDAFEKGIGSQFAGVEGFKPSDMDWVNEHRRSLPSMRLLYDETTECLVIKFVSERHDVAAHEFAAFFEDAYKAKGISRYDLVRVGSGRIKCNNARSKEADMSYRPLTRAMGQPSSFVVEVGLSESLNRLRCDASHWLTKTNGQTKLVLLIHVNPTQKLLQMERWELRQNPRARQSASGNSSHPQKIQALKLSMLTGNPVVSGEEGVTSLTLPWDLIYDTAPVTRADLNGAFKLSENELGEFARRYFTICA
jgi:hypothetical protein